jgi:hypothetical protein
VPTNGSKNDHINNPSMELDSCGFGGKRIFALLISKKKRL